MADMNVKGGYFAPDNYLKVNEGGSHDENPNGGVQIGMDQNGVPNMLEEGEPVYNDFVYSDNIVADDEFLERHDLPKKYKGWLYSKIADDLFEEYSENPLDPISKNGADIMLTRLAECQEEQKLAAEQAQLEEMLASLSPEERDALAQAMMEQQQPAPQDIAMMSQEAAPQEPVPMEGMPMGDSPEQMSLPGQPIMAAYGGPLGGLRRSSKSLSEIFPNRVDESGGIPLDLDSKGRPRIKAEESLLLFRGNPDNITINPLPLFKKPYVDSLNRKTGVVDMPVYDFGYDNAMSCGGGIHRFDRGGFREDDGENWLQRQWHKYIPEIPIPPVITLPGAMMNSYINKKKEEHGGVTVGDIISDSIDMATLPITDVPVPLGSALDAAIEGRNDELAADLAIGLLVPGLRGKGVVKLERNAKGVLGTIGKGVKDKILKPLGKVAENAEGAIVKNAEKTAARKAARAELIDKYNKIIGEGKSVRSKMAGKKMGSSAYNSLESRYGDLVDKSRELAGDIVSNRASGILPYLGESAANTLIPGYQFFKNKALNQWGIGNIAKGILQNAVPGAITYGAIKGLSESGNTPKGNIPAPPEWGNYEAYGGNVNRYDGVTGSSQIQRVNPEYNMGLIPNDGGFFDTYTRGIGGGRWYHSLRPDGTTGASIVGSTPGLAASAGPRPQVSTNNGAIAQVPTAAQQGTGLIPGSELNPMMNSKNMPEWSRAGVPNPVFSYNSSPLVENPDVAERQRAAYYANNPVDESPVVASSENGRRLLSTAGKDLVPIFEGAIGLADIAQSPDRIIAERIKPRMISGQMRLIDPRYVPIDVNQTVNTVTNQNNAVSRNITQSGNPVSTQAALIAADAVGNRNIGEAIAQNKLANEQLYNNAIAGYNNNESVRAQFDLGVDRYNQAADADAQRYNSQLGFNSQYINNQYDTQKWQAVSNQIQRGLDALYANGITNFNMNMVNSNPAFENYGISPSGYVNYMAAQNARQQAAPMQTPVSVPVTTYGAKIQPIIPSYYDSKYMPDYSQQFAENAEKIRRNAGIQRGCGGKIKK